MFYFVALRYMSNSTYHKLKMEFIQCVYCSKVENLHEIRRHMKTKTCLKYKDLYLKVHPDKSEAEFELFINESRNNVLFKEVLEELK